MAISFVTAVAVNVGTASATTLQATVPGSVQTGDLAILVIGSERDLVPSVAWPTTGYTSVEAASNSTVNSTQKGWKRIVSGDLAGTVIATVTTARRMAMAIAFYRNAEDPVFTHGGLVTNANGDLTAEHPNVTPAETDSMLVSIMAANNSIVPYQRTYTSAAGWTERAEAASQSTTANNGFAYIGDKLLSGNAGTPQTGNIVTDASEKFIYYASTAVLAPVATDGIPSGWDEIRIFTRT